MPKKPYYNLLKVLLHIFVWGILFVSLVLLFSPKYVFINNNEEYTVTRISDYLHLIRTFILVASIFYLNYYVLIPKFLSKRKFKEYAGSIILVLIVVSGISYFNRPEPPNFGAWMQPHTTTKMDADSLAKAGFSARTPEPSEMDFSNFHEHFPHRRPLIFNFGILIFAVVSLAVSTSIRGTSEWFLNEKRLKEIENKKLTAELSYLKAQINPHFFFNTLNGIYALARQKSDQTPDVILKLSDLMRYIIYEANNSKVLLSRELMHIQNYIDLQKIRLHEIIQVKYEVRGNAGRLQIEPLLFSVFLENAFKHGVDYSRPGAIEILLSIEGHGVVFMVKNPLPSQPVTPKPKASGVGLKNIKQRLDLIYGERHKLKIYEKEGQHVVELYLDLELEDKVAKSRDFRLSI